MNFALAAGKIATWLAPPVKRRILHSPQDTYTGGNVSQITPETLQSYLAQAETGYLRGIYAFHDEMLARDPHLRALVETSQDYLLEATFAVLPYPSVLRRESQKGTVEATKAQQIADYIEKEFRRPEVRIDLAIRALGFGFGRGIAGLQIVVDPDGPKHPSASRKLERLVSIQEIPGQRFGFDNDTGEITVSLKGDLSGSKEGYVTVNSLGPTVCLLSTDAGMPNPARRGYLRSVLNHWLVRNLGLSWWSRFTELYGTPFRQGTYPDGDAQSRDVITAVLREAGNAGYAVLPEGAKIEIVDTFQRISGHSPHQTLSEWSGREMSKVILGHGQAIEVQQGTGSVQGSKHSDTIAVRRTNARGVQVSQTLRQIAWGMVARGWSVQDALDYTPEIQIVLEQRDSILDLSKAVLNFSQAGLTSLPIIEIHKLAGIRVAEAGEPTLMPIPMPGQPLPGDVGQPSDSREPVGKPGAEPVKDTAAESVEEDAPEDPALEDKRAANKKENK